MKSGIGAVVLAGGGSRRFGRDKAEEIFRGRRLIDWSIDALRPFAQPIFIAGRSHAGLPSVTDRPRAGLGPLGGLAGALRAAGDAGRSHLLSLPCDTPELPAGLLLHLCDLRTPAFLASCPVIGIWPTSLGARLEAYLALGGDLAVSAWAETVGAAAIGNFPPVANVNRIADLVDLASFRG